MGEYAQLNIYIKKDLRKKFRIKCLQEGLSTKAVLQEFITAYVEEDNDKPPGNSKEHEKEED